ncbi:MAG: hypothetical protein ACI4N3_04095 [Alphaproteobacteria bacterium]
MAIKLKSGADLCGMQITRFCIQNDTADPTDKAVGRKYFNTGSGTAAKRERIYTGDTSITSDGWRTQAYLDDLDKLDIASNSDFLALKNKVDDFLEGVDVDDTINKWKELEAFLADYKETDTLANLLGLKANADGSNATGTWAISISGNAATATKLSTGLTYTAWGATFFTSGRPTTISTSTGITVGTLTASSSATLNGGATIPTGKTLKIGARTISCDSNGALSVDGDFYATGQVASGGIADDVEDSDATSTKKKTFAIPIGTTSITLTHNLATRDVVVMIYENTSPYDMILADVTYDTTSAVTVTFGTATTVAHRAVIIG